MRTDKQIYKVFTERPDWFFELTRIESPGPCTFHSLSMKEVSVNADGVIEPRQSDKEWYVFEFQAQFDNTIYPRLVMEMAMLQKRYPKRGMVGVIIFLHPSLDPKTEPWWRVVKSFHFADLLEDLEQRQPDHPLVAVCRPLTTTSKERLESEAATWYNQVTDSRLNLSTRRALEDVFVSWLEQRFRDKGKEEIETMLIGALPDLAETQSGKDLIELGITKGKAVGKVEGKAEGKIEGKVEGKIEGKVESLLMLLSARFGEIPADVRRSLEQLDDSQQIDELIWRAVKINSIDQLLQ